MHGHKRHEQSHEGGPGYGPGFPSGGPTTTASAEPSGAGAGDGEEDGAALTDSVPASAATAVSGPDSAARCSAGGPRSGAATCGRRSSPSSPRSRCTATRSSPSSPSGAGASGDPAPGSVYPTLQVMEDQGLVTADKSEGRRVFSLTDEGRAAADAAGDGPAPWEEAARGADRSLVDLRGLMGEVGAAIMQVGRAGIRPARSRRWARSSAETRRRIYLVLADGGDRGSRLRATPASTGSA